MMKFSKQLKVILSAFACHPEKGSEPGVGWNWLAELSKEHQVYVLICSFGGQKEAVEAAVEKLSYKENIHLIFIPMPQKTNKMLSLLPQLEFYVQHVEWQKEALLEAQKLAQEVDIDIVHHVTYATWTIPSFLWQLQKPFVLGPVTGSQRTPLAGYLFLPFKGITRELSRMVFYFWARIPRSSARETIKKANLVLCGNLETLKEVNSMRNSANSLLMSEVGISNIPDNLGRSRELEQKDGMLSSIFLLWAGLLEPRKNFGLLLEALQILPIDIQWKLFVVGEGLLYSHWQDKVAEVGLEKNIEFLGTVPYQKMADYYQKTDIFVFPSLREGSSTVVPEAMANAVPVIALNLSGMAALLAEDCGILVNVEGKKQMIQDFSTAIECLARDRSLRLRIGNKAYEKVKADYVWDQRREKMFSLYESILEVNK